MRSVWRSRLRRIWSSRRSRHRRSDFPFKRKPIVPPPNTPDVKLDGRDMKPFWPILTTDMFEYGTSANRLDRFGSGVEMGDAALGLAVLGARQPAEVGGDSQHERSRDQRRPPGEGVPPQRADDLGGRLLHRVRPAHHVDHAAHSSPGRSSRGSEPTDLSVKEGVVHKRRCDAAVTGGALAALL